MLKAEQNGPIDVTHSPRKGKRLHQYLAALSVCMGSLAAGAVLGWTGNISEDLKDRPFNGIEIDDTRLGWIGSYANLGAAAACYPVGKLCDVLGRKLSMLLLTVPFLIGWLLIIFSDSLTMLYAGRFMTGFSGCAFCVSAPIYTSEIAEKEIRGTLVSYFELFLTIGIAFAYAIAMITDIRTYTFIMAALPLVFVGTFIFQPESPVFMIQNNKSEKAKKILIRLRGGSYDVDDEIEETKNSLLEEQSNDISLLQSLRKKGTQKAILVCFGLMVLQQACGISAVVSYTNSIFKSAGSKLDPKLATLIVGVMETSGTFAATLIVDKWGRRILLMVSTLFMAISAVMLATYFTLQERAIADESLLSALEFVPIASLSIFVVAFAVGIGPIPWLFSAELFPPEIRSSATGVAASINWFTGFLITKLYLDVVNAVGSDVTFYVFAVISACGATFIFYLVPETKGKTLDEIQKEING